MRWRLRSRPALLVAVAIRLALGALELGAVVPLAGTLPILPPLPGAGGGAAAPPGTRLGATGTDVGGRAGKGAVGAILTSESSLMRRRTGYVPNGLSSEANALRVGARREPGEAKQPARIDRLTLL